jgi:hypothetical protein
LGITLQAVIGVWLLAVSLSLLQDVMQGFIHLWVEVFKIEQQGLIQL